MTNTTSNSSISSATRVLYHNQDEISAGVPHADGDSATIRFVPVDRDDAKLEAEMNSLKFKHIALLKTIFALLPCVPGQEVVIADLQRLLMNGVTMFVVDSESICSCVSVLDIDYDIKHNHTRRTVELYARVTDGDGKPTRIALTGVRSMHTRP